MLFIINSKLIFYKTIEIIDVVYQFHTILNFVNDYNYLYGSCYGYLCKS